MEEPATRLTRFAELRTRLARWLAQPAPPSGVISARAIEPKVGLALFLAALLPRLYVALAWAREPVWDGHYYHFGATRIAQGLGYSEDVMLGGHLTWKPWCHYPVGYSGLLGWVYKLFGPELWVAPVLNAVLSAATVVVVYGLARHGLSPWRARLAALLCALHPGLILYSAVAMTEPLSAFLIALCGYTALLFRGNKLSAVTSGIVVGLGALVRPTTLLAAPWLFALFRGSWRRKAALCVVAGAFTLLTVLPWTLRNCRVMDGCTLISTNGGWNLAIGALTETGRFAPLSAKWGCPGPGQVQQDRCWGEIGRQRIAEDPLHWLGLMPKKLAQLYNHESFAVGYLAEADPSSWPDDRKWDWQRLLTVFHHLLMLAAVLSVVTISLPTPERRWPPVVQLSLLTAIAGFVAWSFSQPIPELYWLITFAPVVALLRLPGALPLTPSASFLWGLVLMTSVTHAVFFGEDRYHLTISPLLCVLAAGALRLAPSSMPTPARLPAQTESTQRARILQRLGARLLRALAKLEWLCDLVFWGIRKKWGRMGPVQLVTYRSFGTQQRAIVRGRVLERYVYRRPTADDDAWTNLRLMWQRFNSHEVPAAVVRATLGEHVAETHSDEEGYFEIDLPIDAEPGAPPSSGQTSVALSLVGCPVRGWSVTQSIAEVFVPSASAEFGVISDIDDTVIQTHVTRRLKMLRTTLFGNAFTRRSFDGTSELYRALVAGPSGAAESPIFYVSKSPWNLYDFLVDFLEQQQLPPGPLLLRDIGLHLQPPLDFKAASIERLLLLYPALPFVLIGDNGEHDPDIYLGLAIKYPGRVRAIYIRRVPGGNATRPVENFQERAHAVGTEMLFIEHAQDALRHAAALGLVALPATSP